MRFSTYEMSRRVPLAGLMHKLHTLGANYIAAHARNKLSVCLTVLALSKFNNCSTSRTSVPSTTICSLVASATRIIHSMKKKRKEYTNTVQTQSRFKKSQKARKKALSRKTQGLQDPL